MRTKDVIRKTKNFTDFYGQDLSDTTNLNTKKDCLKRLQSHKHFLWLQSIDAQDHIESFIRELGIESADEE